MSQGNTVDAQRPVSLKPMRVIVRDRIKQIRSFDGTRYTRVITPAPDAYSQPQVIEVHAEQKLGEKGDEVTVVCNLSGYQRKLYQFKSKDTGEMETVVPVDHALDVMEA